MLSRRGAAREHGTLPIAACVFLCFATTATAQQPGIELKLETHTLELGEAIDVQLVCTNTGSPGTPEAVVPDGLELRLRNPNASTSSFTQIVNGRMSQRTTYTYAMRLAALKEGTYALGPITVVAGGRTYRTSPVRIVVRSSETATAPKADKLIFAELDVEPKSLYVTESYVATLLIGIRKVEIDGRIFELDLLRNVLDQRASQLSTFANGRVKRSERGLTDSNGVAHRYEIFRVTSQVRAEEVGETLVGPVFLKANYPTAMRVGFFRRYEVSRVRKETARAAAITVKVKAPPEAGRPADFAGAIGRYTMSVTAKPTRLEQGQPVTLTISIEGAPLEGVAGPDLTRQPELASRFDYTGDELVGDLEGGAKVFRRAIFPKQPGEQTVPPISWSFFDPRQERYVSLTSDPLSLTVDPPSAAGGDPDLRRDYRIALLDKAEIQTNGTTLTVLTGGISPNFVDPDALLADHSFAITAPWVVSLVISPLVWLVVTSGTRHRARLKADVHLARRRRARRQAHARIRLLVRDSHLAPGEPAGQMHGLAEVMTGYLSDHFGLPPGTLTPDEVRSLLAAHGFEETTTAQVVDFLEACDAVCYAPGAMGTLSAAEAAAHVRGWIKRIEEKTRRTSTGSVKG